jgi:hypothetical protein
MIKPVWTAHSPVKAHLPRLGSSSTPTYNAIKIFAQPSQQRSELRVRPAQNRRTTPWATGSRRPESPSAGGARPIWDLSQRSRA